MCSVSPSQLLLPFSVFFHFSYFILSFDWFFLYFLVPYLLVLMCSRIIFLNSVGILIINILNSI